MSTYFHNLLLSSPGDFLLALEIMVTKLLLLRREIAPTLQRRSGSHIQSTMDNIETHLRLVCVMREVSKLKAGALAGSQIRHMIMLLAQMSRGERKLQISAGRLKEFLGVCGADAVVGLRTDTGLIDGDRALRVS